MIHNLAVDESCVELPLAEYYVEKRWIERKKRNRDEMGSSIYNCWGMIETILCYSIKSCATCETNDIKKLVTWDSSFVSSKSKQQY
jgi:hypothetical protein